ncbi:MAG: hypothetical protein V4492_00915 [Chlamydiota bacterium]
MANAEKLIASYVSSPSLEQFSTLVGEEKSLLVEELWEGPKAALVYLLARTTKKHILLVSGGSEDRLFQDISFFPNFPHGRPSLAKRSLLVPISWANAFKYSTP